MTPQNEKNWFDYGFLTVFVTMGIVYLLTGNFSMTANAGCAGACMVMVGLLSIRYKTEEVLNKNKLLNRLAIGLFIGFTLVLGASVFITSASALSVNTSQEGAYTYLDIDGKPPFDVYTDDGSNVLTYSDRVSLKMTEGKKTTVVVVDGLNDTAKFEVDMPVINVDIFITFVVIVAFIFALLGIRYPLFVLPSMALSLIWFGYMSKNINLNETSVVLHSLFAVTPFLSMAYWGINR